ncbi:MAG: glycosyltransferase family 2 protein [Candidatus Accumulibacter sp.]|jgi:GT2 family glycosyltransferase|uniref:glycosyltransferase family 2 protein n=1 Tax=Accumulibacter sp. TaxID=2053492 RepID=UPI002582B776|nr:glycosyltransferase family 2 protein [Accumulibacter sp.]MBK8115184.1 glycosyltransferase family 2 protein [Accumulibacter sp.]
MGKLNKSQVGDSQSDGLGNASVTVVIVNWNGGEMLKECLEHLLQQTYAPTRILVMDNGSSDGSAERVEGMDGVTVKQLGSNLGFAAANNHAIFATDTEFIALLNPDAFAEPNWLAQLIKAAKDHPKVAAFGSRQLIQEMPDKLDGIGDIYHFSGLAWRKGYRRIQTEADLGAVEIFSPCAAAALFRRDALVEVGGFDEDFFCYLEDVDLGFRLRLAGYQSQYIPEAVVYHIGSVTSGGRHSDFSVYHGHRNLVWTFIKNMPGILFWTLLPAHILLNIFSVAYIASRGQGKIIFKAKWDALKGIPAMWRKRKSIQALRRALIRDIWRMLDKRLELSRR